MNLVPFLRQPGQATVEFAEFQETEGALKASVRVWGLGLWVRILITLRVSPNPQHPQRVFFS